MLEELSGLTDVSFCNHKSVGCRHKEGENTSAVTGSGDYSTEVAARLIAASNDALPRMSEKVLRNLQVV
jgi:hypothetical protein